MKEINGKKYSEEELRAIYKFFTVNDYDYYPGMPHYSRLKEVGFDKDSKECTDLADIYKTLGEYDKIMSETHGKAYELAIMYRDFKSCLPFYLDENGEHVFTPYGMQRKELEECDDKEIIESIQRMYDKYMETKNKLFRKSLRKLLQ